MGEEINRWPLQLKQQKMESWEKSLASSSAFFPLLFYFSSTICAELNFDYEKSIQIATFCLFFKKGVVGK